jgi:hypothetical protein
MELVHRGRACKPAVALEVPSSCPYGCFVYLQVNGFRQAAIDEPAALPLCEAQLTADACKTLNTNAAVQCGPLPGQTTAV